MTPRSYAASLALVAIVGSSATARGEAIERIVTLGDSLSDTGNVFLGTQAILDGGGTLPPQPPLFDFPIHRPIPPSPPYFDGRFSNGPVWLEGVVEQLDRVDPRSALPVLAGGFNYAFGGAQTTDQPEDPLNLFIDLDEQLQWFLSTDTPREGDLFVVFAGANDLLLGNPASADPVASAQRVAAAVQAITDAGGERFFVPNLPALGELPATRNTPISHLLNDATGAFNATLSQALDALEATDPEAKITRFDVFGLYEAIRADPAAFGVTNFMDPALDPLTGEVVGDAEDYVFFDPIHISATTHRLLGQEAARLIAAEAPVAVPTPAASAMGLGILCGGLLLRRRRS